MIGIIGAMEDEVAMLRDAIVNPRQERLGSFDFVCGRLEQEEVALLRCGIGKVNAAIGCALMLSAYRPAFVINSGSAGGIDPALNVGDAIIADGLLQHDVDVRGFGYEAGQVPGLPAVFPVPREYILQAERAVEELKQEGRLPPGFSHARGLIGSGDVFVDNEKRIDAIRQLFPNIRAVEMEGAAIAQCCYLFSTPAITIRSLSDIAGKESPVKFQEFLPIAAKHSGEIVRRIIRNWS